MTRQSLTYRQHEAHQRLEELRELVSLRGDVVSDSGRELTIEVFGSPLSPIEIVEIICREVQTKGRSAVLKYTELLDRKKLTPESMRVSPEELASAHHRVSTSFLETVRRIQNRIHTFQTEILHQDTSLTLENQCELKQRYRPLKRVGICIPGGAAAYPSTVLMTVVPALAAGVRELAVVAPPTEFGAYNDDLLSVCHELGVTEVYRMGGAQAVAALAYGIEGVPRVDKIVGPGNLFVQLAKKHVFGNVDIDLLAGPSEVVILGDHSANPEWIAADLIAQAEHDPGVAVLISWDSKLIEAVDQSIQTQLTNLSRGALAHRSLQQFGALILVDSQDEAIALANNFAPEHLEIATENPDRILDQIDHAGAIFLGHESPVALGDYVAGPSHVLPTSGTARFACGLSANEFLRRSSIIQFSLDGVQQVADDVRTMAHKEGLTAHSASVDKRLCKEHPPKE
ncbi:MAG: histidinol dehydrogenase [Planctomycetota bacterium]|nr:histidinol dehydrogenase [Planctomycetota bacterium]